jgi:hypothetical protein
MNPSEYRFVCGATFVIPIVNGDIDKNARQVSGALGRAEV